MHEFVAEDQQAGLGGDGQADRVVDLEFVDAVELLVMQEQSREVAQSCQFRRLQARQYVDPVRDLPPQAVVDRGGRENPTMSPGMKSV
ncbi:MAG: hypothetical protein RIC56_10305 [Pseudomonadales bacterium]